MERLLKATINSWHGLIACTKSEAAFREELALLIVELLNTAIEKLADRVTRDTDPLIKRVKDMGSAAIFLSLVAAGVTWMWVVAEKFWR